jgi:hypothetical protein
MGLAFVLGWLACLVVVVAAVTLTTQGKPPAPNTAPSTAALAVKLALGVTLVLYAWRRWRRIGAPRKPSTLLARLDGMSLWGAAGLAAFLQPWALVAAGAATITQAKLSGAADYLTLVLFVLLATASFLYLELYATLAPGAADVRVQGLRTWLDIYRDQVVILLSLLLGLWLVGNSLYYLA